MKFFIKTAICGLLLSTGASAAFRQNNQPKTVRDFFDLIPSEYFSIFCCDENKDEYVKKYVTVSDTANGFMEGLDTEEDTQYRGFRLKVFPSANGRTILGLYSHSVLLEDYYFLEYKNGKLINSSKTIPNYSQENIYEFPRTGATIKVYKKKYSLPGKLVSVDNPVSRREYIYSLIRQNGKFAVRK